MPFGLELTNIPTLTIVPFVFSFFLFFVLFLSFKLVMSPCLQFEGKSGETGANRHIGFSKSLPVSIMKRTRFAIEKVKAFWKWLNQI